MRSRRRDGLYPEGRKRPSYLLVDCRSEALRRSMLALIEKGEPHEAHPAYWAPFVVVGEGS